MLESEWYDFAAKYEPNRMRLRGLAGISPAARDELRAVAVEAFDHFGCSGLARADFFVEGDAVLLNELNTMRGFTTTSVYAKRLGGDRRPLRRARHVPVRARHRALRPGARLRF